MFLETKKIINVITVLGQKSHINSKEKIRKLITENNGGQGAVREICELIMTAQNNFQNQIKELLSS